MMTERESVRLLCKSIISRLENQKVISFAARLRQVIADEVFHLIGPVVLTDQDLRERALARIGASVEALKDSQFSESDQFKAARAIVRASFGDDELNGFYFQKPVKYVANSIASYFMRSSHIDDVYEADDEVEQKIVEVIKKFDPKQVH